MVRIQLFSFIQKSSLLKSLQPIKKTLNSKRARKLSLILNSTQPHLKQLSSQVLLSHTAHTLHKFAHLLTLSSICKKANYRLGRKPKPFTLVGVPKFYRNSVFLLPTYSRLGTPIHRKSVTRSEFFRNRAFEVSSGKLSRIIGSYNSATRYDSNLDVSVRGVPNSINNLLSEGRRAEKTLALQLFLILRRRLSVKCRLRSIKLQNLSAEESYESSRARRLPTPGSHFFSRNYVQNYIASAYSDLPKTVSRTLRDFTVTLFSQFYNSHSAVLRNNSSVFAA